MSADPVSAGLVSSGFVSAAPASVGFVSAGSVFLSSTAVSPAPAPSVPPACPLSPSVASAGGFPDEPVSDSQLDS